MGNIAYFESARLIGKKLPVALKLRRLRTGNHRHKQQSHHKEGRFAGRGGYKVQPVSHYCYFTRLSCLEFRLMVFDN
jgi:hypothetical protein